MVERTSQETRLQGPGKAQYAELNLGAGVMRRPEEVKVSAMDQALDSVLTVGGKLASKVVDYKAQEAYLNGQRARMAGEAESAVDSDPFSAPFVKGGYQDEDYRIAQAELAREMDLFIKGNGKSMSPTEFAKVLKEKASAYTPKFDSLSMRGKLQALTSQTKLEESLFTKQAVANQKWSIEQGSKRFLAQGNQIMTDLMKADDPATRQANVERAALFYTDLMTSEKIPQEARQQMAQQYLGALANADQRDVIEQLRDSGALDVLSFDQRKKLDTAMRESAVRTEARDALGVVQANADLEQRVGAGKATAEELEGYIVAEVNAKRMSYDQAKSLRMKFLTGLSNKDNMTELMQALGNRDLDAMAALGFTGAEGLEQMDKQLAANEVPLTDRLKTGLQIGLDIGQLPKSFGDTIAMSVRAIQAADPQNPVSGTLVDSLNAVVGTLAVAEQKNPGARGVLLGNMPEDTRAAMSYVLRQQEVGVTPAAALKEFATNRDAFAKLDSLEQSFRTQAFRKELNDRVDSEVTSGFFGRIGNALSGNSNLSTNPYNAATMAAALQDELGRITTDRNNMGLNADAALDLAVANVQARTIPVGERGWFGTGTQRRGLIMPAGVNVEQVFGSTDKMAIGRILSQEYPAAANGFESSFRFNRATGVLENIQVNENGQIVSTQQIDPSSIGRRIREDNERILNEASAAHFGQAVQINGQDFRIDGGNTYGIPVKLAYGFRKELTGQEGLSLTVYKDRNGLAAGVGHNVTGTDLKEGDKISLQQAEAWFRADTDMAMAQATRMGRELGVRDVQALAGMAGAIFQLGDAGLREHTRTAAAIRNRDYNAFVKEVRSSEWAKQTPQRAEWFISKMAGHFAPGALGGPINTPQ